MLPTKDPPQNKTLTQTETEGLEIFQANRQGKRNRVAILISHKIDFQRKYKQRYCRVKQCAR